MANMTPQDAAMLKILQRKYGKSVYPMPTPTKKAVATPKATVKPKVTKKP